MQSSPFMSSAISHQATTDRSVPIRSIVIVGEQDLDSTLLYLLLELGWNSNIAGLLPGTDRCLI